MDISFKKEHFEKALNSNFRIQLEEDIHIDLNLDKLKVQERPPKGYECFTLVFKGPKSHMLPQQVVQMTQKDLGAMPIFLVPVDEDSDHYYYEAVFNMKLPEA